MKPIRLHVLTLIFLIRATLLRLSKGLAFPNEPCHVCDGKSRYPSAENKQSMTSRRRFCSVSLAVLSGAVTAATTPCPRVAVAEDGIPAIFQKESESLKPYAPLEALLPAMRVKLLIDRSMDLALALQKQRESDISNMSSFEREQEETDLVELRQLLLGPQNFTQSSSTIVLSQPGKVYRETYKRALDQLPLLEKPGALLVQNGEISAWKRLQNQERIKESADPMRAAFNAYTSQVSFRGDAYVLNVPKAERSRMIRQDALPDIKSVINADMDLRYLYRNIVLTAMEEARAELSFQLSEQEKTSSSNTIDTTELVQLLGDAQKACNAWFDFIDEGDVLRACDALSS